MAEAAFSTAETKRFPWWLILIEGIALIILGLLFLANPASTTVIFIQVLGIWWLVGGMFKIVSIFIDHSAWGWKLVAGILGILAGLIILQHPLWSPFVVGGTLVLLLGIQGVIYGTIELFMAFKGAGWGAGILGALSIVFGLYLLFNIRAATLVLPWVVGILAIVGGIAVIVMAFRQKAEK